MKDQGQFRFVPCTEAHDRSRPPHGRLVDLAYSHGEKCDQGGCQILAIDSAESLLDQLVEGQEITPATRDRILGEARQHDVPERIIPPHLSEEQYLLVQQLGSRQAHRQMWSILSEMCLRRGILPC